MKYRNVLMVLAGALSIGFSTTLPAVTDDESASKNQEAESQATLEAEFKKAMALSAKERQAAEASIEKAQEQLRLAAEQRAKAASQDEKAKAARQAEMEKMQEELERARRQLRETSREVARVNREVARARTDNRSRSFIFSTSERPVIGVILGGTDEEGVKVLGVSPDGPSERAGIRRGDVIVALNGRQLTTWDESGNARIGLYTAMHGIKPGQEVILTVRRADKTLDLPVVPEIREPLTWQTVTRFPTAPAAPVSPAVPDSPRKVTIIEGFDIPEIDTAAISEQIEQMRLQIEERAKQMAESGIAPLDHDYEIEFHQLSELGDLALQDTNMWFGLPMTQGLKLAEIDPGLGEYFKTDRGVLVLKAKADNDLQLKSGDVILQVGDTEVNSPADFMRALREIESGQEMNIDIKRDRKNLTLNTTMPERRTSFWSPEFSKTHTIRTTRDTD